MRGRGHPAILYKSLYQRTEIREKLGQGREEQLRRPGTETKRVSLGIQAGLAVGAGWEAAACVLRGCAGPRLAQYAWEESKRLRPEG